MREPPFNKTMRQTRVMLMMILTVGRKAISYITTTLVYIFGRLLAISTGNTLPASSKDTMMVLKMQALLVIHLNESIYRKPSTYTYNSGILQKRSADGCTKKRDNDLHRLLFMPNGLPDGAELAYYVKGQDYSVPDSGWHCLNCKDNTGDGRGARPIMIWFARVDEEPEYEMGGFVVCRENDFSVDTFDDRTVIICDQCEEYHVGCLRDIGLCELEELPKDKWFCCNDCNRIYVALQNSVFAVADTIFLF
ncbi:unnamed protein product [Trifolium pratense]|uniref:Uncharacterized protein n=1 Tax=Trifolium pratense TaxID=57577 RepID=A0ACB0K5L2_TRIPR|nr:unnamed protein product [Trifolium pratense]